MAVLLTSASLFAAPPHVPTKYYVNDASQTGDVYTSAVGNNANLGTSAAAPKATLANTLTTYSASFGAGDTIFVDAGTYTNTDVNLTSPANGVVIKGAGAGITTFAYSNADGYFMNVTTNNTVLANFTLSGYNGDSDFNIEVLNIAATGVQVNGVVVSGSRAPESANYSLYPIMVASGANVVFNGGGVSCNTDATEGGGMSINGSGTVVKIENYQFVGNANGNNGVALVVNAGTVNIYNTRFVDNSGTSDEVGSAIYQVTGTVKVYDSYFKKNTTNVPDNAIGGAISIAGGTFLITRSYIVSNTYSGGNGIYGSGIGVTSGTVTIDSTYFTSNVGSRANDVYVGGGTVTAYNNSFSSAANQIGMAGGSFTIANSGNPSIYGGTVTKTNTTAPSYGFPVPTLPAYINTCGDNSLLCTPPTITVSSKTDVLCKGNSTGAITVSASGATAPYTYSWSGAASGSTTSATGLAAATYTVTITDATACAATSAVKISAPSAVVAANPSGVNATCGTANGIVSASPTGGTGAYTYSWSTGASAQTVSSLSPATYTITVTDHNGCTAASTVAISNVPGPSASIAPGNNIAVKCYGTATGSLSVSVSAGTSPYTYSWSNGATSATIANVAAATYTVTVLDANGCSSQTNATISQPAAALTAGTLTPTSITCAHANGSLTTSPSGGTTPYTYAWSNGATSQNLSNVASAAYTVTITDANGCTATSNAHVDSIAIPKSVINPVNNIAASCYGTSTGSLTVTATAGTTPYTYLWSNGGTASTAANLAANSYTVTTTDAHGCTTVTTATVGQPAAALATGSLTATSVTCAQVDGALTTSPSGGTTPYTYAWSNGATSQNLSNVASATYTVTITDAKGCTATSNAHVDSIAIPKSVISPVNNIAASCYGTSTGSLTVTATAGTAPYTYLWSNGGTSATAANLAAGNYTVTTTDAHGCTTVTTATVGQPAAALATGSLTATSVTCAQVDGALTTSPSGGTTPYTYAWSNGATSQNLSNVASATYTVTITDAKGCTATSNAHVDSIAIPKSVINPVNNIAASCYGTSTGSLTVTATAGTTPYTYLWSNGGTASTAANLAANSYTVTTTDAHGCTTVTTATVGQPAAALATGSLTATSVTCAQIDGALTTSPSGGTTPYTYAWSNGATSQNLSNVASATYTVTITDAKGCTATSNAHVDSIAIPKSVINPVNNIAASCYGTSTGSLTVTATAGTAPYTYLWSNGGTASTAANLASGNYTVTTTDAHGCTTVTTATVGQPAAALATGSLTATSVTCAQVDGALTTSPSGGTTPYTYAWSNGATSQNLSNVASATYTVTITDAKGCTATSNAHVDSIAIPKSVINPVNNIAASCYGTSTGSLTVTATAGTTPYTYLWSNGGTASTAANLAANSYTVTTTDAHGCTTVTTATVGQPAAALATGSLTATSVTCAQVDGALTTSPSGGTTPYTYAWSNGATSQNLSNVASATYTVTITDAKGCTATSNAHVDSIAIPKSVINPVNNIAASCYGTSTGSLTVTVTAGTAPYTYLWSNGGTSATAANLASGNYTVTTTDAHGCTTVTTATVGQPQAPLSAGGTLGTTSSTCSTANGAVTTNPTGGTGAYTFNWSNGATSQNITNVGAGTYAVTITDAHGCSVTSTAQLDSVQAPQSLIAANNNVAVKCYGASTGSLTVTLNAGTAPYTYLWSNGGTTLTDANLAAGTYSVTTTDAHGCSTVTSATVNQPQTPVSAGDALGTTPSTCSTANGSITTNPTGGTGAYTFNWSNGATTQNLTNVAANTYSVTITDANGCSVTSAAQLDSVQAPQSLIAANNNIAVNCYGASTGSLAVTVNAGTAPFTYSWSNGGNAATNANLSAGNYTVTTTDAHGCSTVASATVTQPQAPVTAGGALGTTSSTCSASNGSITTSPTGGTGAYTFNWSNGATTQNITNVGAGTYAVTITDANGCSATSTAQLDSVQAPQSLIAANNNIAVKCYGVSTGSLTVTVNAGTAPFTYSWSNGGTSATNNNLAAGTYTVTTTDANGCSTVANATVAQPQTPVSAGGTLGTTPSTCSTSNGSITTNPTGGTGAYTFNWSNGATTQNLTNVAANAYTVTITDANGCTATSTAQLDSIQNLIPVQGPATPSVSCFGKSDGSIPVLVYFGTAPFQYSCSNGTSGTTGGNSFTVAGLAVGNYTITITDANGCSNTYSAPVYGPVAPLTGVATGNQLATTPITCSQPNGTATSNASGGTSPYSYSWSNGATTATVSNLQAATYILTITDNNGCTVLDTATVDSIPVPKAVFTNTKTVSCYGGADGSLTVLVHQGTPIYSYSWSTGSTDSTIIGLATGNYTVTVTDAKGCTSVANALLGQPQVKLGGITTSASNAATCNTNNGTLTVRGTGGTPGYTYLWFNNSNDSVVSGLAPQSYSVQITDSKGCVDTATFNVQAVPMPVITFPNGNVINPTCSDATNGSATAAVNAGTPGYTYSWSDGKTNTPTIVNIGQGTYTVTITDNSGCSVNNTVTLVAPAQIDVQLGQHLSTCGNPNGSLIARVTGGTGNYTYSWSNATAGVSNLAGNVDSIVQLAPGVYTVTVTDANGCVKTANGKLDSSPAANLLVLQAANDSICVGQSANIAVTSTGGKPPLTYIWSNGLNIDNAQTVSPIVTTTYSVQVKDSAGCLSNTQNITVKVRKPLAFSSVDNNVDVCSGSQAQLWVKATGGNASSYAYTWSPAAVQSGESTLSITAGAPTNGTPLVYTVTVTDNNCSQPIVTTVAVNVNPTPVPQITTAPQTACGSALVNFAAQPTGPGVQQVWNYGDNTATSSVASHQYTQPNTYTVSVTVTSVDGCSATATAPGLVQILANPVVNFTTTPDMNLVQDSLILFNNQTQGAVSQFWNFGAKLGNGNFATSTEQNPSYTYADTGRFRVVLTVTGANTCVDSAVQYIEILPKCAFPATMPNVFSPNEDHLNDLFIIDGAGFETLKSTIFNRWGTEVFQYNARGTGWDGRTFNGSQAPEGTYFYLFEGTCKLGGKPKAIQGFITLFR